MAKAAAWIAGLGAPDPGDMIQLVASVVIEGGPDWAGYQYVAYVPFDASSDAINSAIVDGAIAIAAVHSITVTEVRVIGGAMARVG